MSGSRNNMEIRQMALNNNVCHWEIADKMGIAEGSLSRKLRKELSAEEKQKVMDAIKSIVESR